MDLYADNVLDHYKHPRNTGSLKNATVSHREENLSCGDDLTVHLKIAGEKITLIRWEGTGCAISQAAMSMLSEELSGKTTDEIADLKPDDVRKILGVPVGPRRIKCALLCLHTLKNALRKWRKQKPQDWLQTVEVEN
ncbi:MAG: iron-sulfur cluster assembly scaffold protein [Candidatus Peribacteraceae bacterium]|nr:iron-sulfur cluster assembly scaffold protein [Candidatus Peribacteraceae bacterium]